MKSTEILLFIVELSKWTCTSFVPIIYRFALLWGGALHVSCSIHYFWPIPTVLFEERSGILEFSSQIDRQTMQIKQCHAASTHAHLIFWTCRSRDLSFPSRYNPHLSSCLCQTAFGAEIASEKRICNLRSQMILRNRVRSGDTKPDTIYIEMTNPARRNEFLADLHHLRATVGIPSSRRSLSMDRSDGTSTSRG